MNQKMPIQIAQGEIYVEAIFGKIEEDYFVLYLTTREKYPGAEVICTGSITQVNLFATRATLRHSHEGESYVPIRSDESSTLVELPGGWEVGASASGYTVCILGVRSALSVGSLSFTKKESE